eukprot:1558702-Prymnesium_polylepis.2
MMVALCLSACPLGCKLACGAKLCVTAATTTVSPVWVCREPGAAARLCPCGVCVLWARRGVMPARARVPLPALRHRPSVPVAGSQSRTSARRSHTVQRAEPES